MRKDGDKYHVNGLNNSKSHGNKSLITIVVCLPLFG